MSMLGISRIGSSFPIPYFPTITGPNARVRLAAPACEPRQVRRLACNGPCPAPAGLAGSNCLAATRAIARRRWRACAVGAGTSGRSSATNGSRGATVSRGAARGWLFGLVWHGGSGRRLAQFLTLAERPGGLLIRARPRSWRPNIQPQRGFDRAKPLTIRVAFRPKVGRSMKRCHFSCGQRRLVLIGADRNGTRFGKFIPTARKSVKAARQPFVGLRCSRRHLLVQWLMSSAHGIKVPHVFSQELHRSLRGEEFEEAVGGALASGGDEDVRGRRDKGGESGHLAVPVSTGRHTFSISS